ncbi:MAG: tRNA pseudouridine(55) synthase TruB [Metamycoplasmataceae bacterium]
MITVIKKEKGLSSFKAIKDFSRKYNYKKIGHSGTLDPLASGLLLVATENDTKLLEFIENKTKKYIAEATIGSISDTYDSEGEIVPFSDYVPTKEELNICLNSFLGKSQQIPPKFSAKKINGKRGYELARKGKDFVLEPSLIEIFNIELLSYDKNSFSFSVEVSSGTYIRSLIYDIGQKLKCGSYMSGLERVVVNGISDEFLEKPIPYDLLFSFETINFDKREEIKLFMNGFTSKEWNLKNGINGFIWENLYFAFILVENDKIIKRKIFSNIVNEIIINK